VQAGTARVPFNCAPDVLRVGLIQQLCLYEKKHNVPKVPIAQAKEMVFSARIMDGIQAQAAGLVNESFATPEDLHQVGFNPCGI